MKFSICIFLVFISGVNASNNLNHLIATNPLYEAAWWKVGLSVILAIVFSIAAYKSET